MIRALIFAAIVIVWPDQPQNFRMVKEVAEPPPTVESGNRLGIDYEIMWSHGKWIVTHNYIGPNTTVRMRY